ncbi:plasmid replication protein, CyRepA1 family [Nostoc sp. 'Peltigera membranacea cyanobiont' 232]|uniref:plasmid replication protein, CyRepA1 family n=1 Tax=Nostoc sp. 'Peltigera membranacea cyanobiont' 232 TaxID=2014531 RepID=UPI000B953FB1|nr:plasmid replication protein, CyRepA1 family [Nostoc sp. 'Peltigera membranacea cyanobiont' 232]OYE04056.1 bifunctional DNA primase/helicase [Nostoc sp. 'Peltigera membranacea cyanobiont' 232]
MRIIESASQAKHQQEWLNSGVDEEIIALNVRSLHGTTPYEYLLYSPKISRRNDGRLRDRDLKKYQHIELGGWWCNGIDPLNEYALMMWGCFKPDQPRRDRQKIHKFIKYEHPYREETRAFFLLVPNRIWVKVSNRSGIPITEEDLQHPGGFWHWVWRHNVPVTIVEGVKKAACLLTAGYAAIAIPGVNAGYRTPTDEYGTANGKPFLIPDLKYFATEGRQVNICFDQDNKPETVQRVRTAISRMGRLLVNEGCSLRVIDLPFGPEKGVDDFIVAKGKEAFDALYNTAVALELWEIKLFTLLTYPPGIALNQRFLGQLLVPEGEKLIILKAPKGTGKTEWLATEVAKAHDQGQRVLIITHRIQLGEALCNRFGVNYVTEVRTNETGTLLGYGVCVDSLHQESQARFNPNDWSNDVIIIDECDQVFWHLLNSGTEVQKRRVSVLKNLKQLVQNILGSSQGKIYLSSADVSDTDVKYVLSLAGEYRVNPFVIVNNYRHVAGNCYNYSGSNPKNLIAALDKAISKGGHHLLCCSAQKAKSKWGTQALEERFRRKFPHLRILRIDSESVADPSHAAFGCIAHLNEILTQYDLVIASPSLETGVSIDIRGHFDGVWGIFQGVQPVNSVRQMLARVRETVDRHIWVREWGMSVVGNGSTTIGGLLRSQHVATQANIALLSAADNDDYSYVDQNFQPESLQTWGKRGSVINVEMRRYRESVLAGLVEDGYTIIDASDVDDDESGAVIESVKAASQELYASECQAIANSDELSGAELKKLQDKRAKTKTERHQQRKAELSRRYEVDVTPDLVEKDDDGWYPQLRMHYYLTLGREFLTTRDAKRAKAQLEAGENSIWKPDFNKGQLLPAVLLLENLNLLQFLTPDVQLRGSDEKMLEFKVLAVQHRHVIKNYLNVSISEKHTPIAIAQKLLAKIDLKLDYVGRLGKRENRECVYRFVAPDDQRDSIFRQWFNWDEVFLSESVSVTNNIEFPTQVTGTISDDIPQTLNQVESPATQAWKGLKLKLQQGLDSAGQFYQQLVSAVGAAIGVADGEPYWNGYLGQWQVWVNFGSEYRSVVCDWLVAV